MQCFVYKCSEKQQLYVFVKNKDDFSCLPETLISNLGNLELVIEMELTPDRKLAKENAVQVIASLNEKGYFIQMPAVSISAPTSLH
jgi:uncharacterized protein YcgL (UPF0745 family)